MNQFKLLCYGFSAFGLMFIFNSFDPKIKPVTEIDQFSFIKTGHYPEEEQILFEDNFENDEVGRMPKFWKSSGSGEVSVINGEIGNWLKLSPKTTYRIDSLIEIPRVFAISFDLVTRSDQARDIGAMLFGFSRDNAQSKYIMGASNRSATTSTQLHFWNRKITTASSATDIYDVQDFPLDSYSNKKFRVMIEVEHENMLVYIDGQKILDTKMFSKDDMKYFYLSSPFSYKSDAIVYFGNFKMSGRIT